MTYSSGVLADSPLAYYRLGDTSGTTATDSSGNAHTGTYTNTPTLGATGLLTGDSDKAMATVTATGQRVVVASDSFGWMNTASTMCVEAIIRYTGASVDGDAIVSRWSSGVNAWRLYRDSATGHFFGGLRTGFGGGSFFTVDSGITPVTGVTYHLAIVYDSTPGTFRIYVNGALSNTTSSVAGFVNSNGFGGDVDLEIGRHGSSNATTPTATIDEVAYYGTALSGSRIAAHYGASIAATSYSPTVLADSPLVYWKFDATSGTAVADSSGNAHNGVLAGSTTFGGPSLITAAGGSMVNPGNGGAHISQASWMETSTFTHELIAKPSALGGNQILCARDDLGGSPSTRHSLFFASGSDLRGAVHTNTNEVTFANGVFTVGQTYHLAMTYDGTTAKAYVNGSLVGSFVPSGSLTLTSGQDIGVAYTPSFAGIWQFNGNIDEYAYYGTALSGTRIAAHYAASIAPASTTSQGTSAGTYLWAGTGTGRRLPKAVTSGTYLWAGTGVGKRSPKATTSGTYLWAGTGVGARPSAGVKQGTGVGAFNWSGTSTGVRPALTIKTGTAVGVYRWAGTGVGGVVVLVTTTRWTLREKSTGETWTMQLNPNTMTGLPMAKQLTTTANTGYQGDQRNRTVQTQPTAGQLEWSGVILTAAHYQDLLTWSRKPGVIVVTDHLQRSFEVIIQAFTPETRPGRQPDSPKRTYKMTTLFLRRLP